jgi:hypothetical protein
MTVRIFQDISLSDGEQAIRQSIPAILDRAQELRLFSRKWSLAELQLDADDFAWLCDWASNLSGRTLHLWLEDNPWYTFRVGSRECTCSTALGILLLLFTTETARRKATEGFLWSIFQHNCFPPSTTRTLYAGGQPTRTHKDALEAGARWLNLRHVFGIEGLQNWFDTVYLQFGFTYKGFQRRLPEWLVGQGGTQAIQHLLDGSMKSDTFRALWDDLRNFRRKNIKADLMRARLANNPWILPEWIEELLIQATAKIELGEGSEAASTQANDDIDPFISEPILRWDPPKAPEFVCYVSNIAQFELSDPLYYVMINGRAYTQLQRSPDGVYVFHPSEEIALPTTLPILVATLISSAGQVIASNTLTLWDTNDEVIVFRASSGKRIDVWQDMMRPEAAYSLITAPDTTLVPEPQYWHKLDAPGTTLWFVNAGWPASLSLQLDGQLLWQPNMKDLTKGEEPRWARSIDIALYDTSQQIAFGDVVRAIIYYPDDIFVSFIRLNSKPIDFIVGDNGSVITEPVVVSPDMLFHGTHLAELSFTIGVRKEVSSARVTRAVNVEVIGAAILSIQGWIALQPDRTMTVEQAKTFPVQIFRPHIKQWALLEGDSWVGRPRPTPHPIGSLAGLGAPVKLRLGPYNAIDPDAPLVREVMNRGIIDSVRKNHERDDFSYTIQLTYPIELDEHHEVIIWDEDGLLHIGNPDYFLVQVRGTPTWVLELPGSAVRPLVIAIAYDGVRLGAWWEDSWSNVLQHQQTQDLQTVATMMRWFQLPILSDRDLPQVQQLVQQAGSRILPLWLSDTLSHPHLRWVSEDERWLSAIRIVFKNWGPSDMAARRLVTQLGGTSEHLEEPLTRTAWRLLRVDPLLMGRILQKFVREVYLPQFGVKGTQSLFRTLVSTLAESASDQEVLQQKNALLETTSDTMGSIDTNFIRRGLLDPALRLFQRKATTSIEENNIALALSIEPFRRLLGIRILEYIAQSVATRR